MLCPFSLTLVNKSKTSFLALEFKAPVGSSANISDGSLINALAILALCCSPPETCDGSLFCASNNPTYSSNSLALLFTSFGLYFFSK